MKVKKFTGFFIVASVLAMTGFSGFFGNGTGILLAKTNLAKAQNVHETETKAQYAKDHILVKFKAAKNAVQVFLTPAESINMAVEKYAKDPAVEFAEPDYLYQASIIPSDTFYGEQWYLKKIKAQDAWDEKYESPRVTIAVIDSGVQIDHPDLKESIWTNPDEADGNKKDDDHDGYIDDVHGWDFVNSVADPSPKFKAGATEGGLDHGTIVAGIAAAEGNNAAGVAGVSWKAKIMPLKVLDDAGQGSTLNVIKAIDYAIAKGANILNFSFVGFGYSEALNQAIKRAHDAGLIIVAAAGNEAEDGSGYYLDDTPMYPVCYDGPSGENWIIGVAATDSIDQKSKFSSFGFRCIDVSAPGESVFGTVAYNPGFSLGDKTLNKYYDGYWSGTSVATPQVSGALALLEDADFGLDSKQLTSLILDHSDNISRVNPNYLGQLGRGRLNVYNSVDAVISRLDDFSGQVVSVPKSGAETELKLADKDGNKSLAFKAFTSSFRGGASLASGDVNGDGSDEIIVGAGPGGGPHVRIFSSAGLLKGQFFAYDQKFTGGVNVAVADLNDDGIDEIITAPASNGGPHIRAFDMYGKVKTQFFAYDKKFLKGVNVAAGDIDGDGAAEIVTGPAAEGGSLVRVFSASGKAKGEFSAYGAFKGGVRVAVGNVYNLSRLNHPQIITAPGPGLAGQIKVYGDRFKLLKQFNAYTINFKGGVSLAAGDMNNDGVDEIITGAGPGGAPHVRVFSGSGSLIGSYYALAADFNKGVNVGYLKVNK